MQPNDFTTTILVDKTPAEVFDAITNVRSWWQGEIEGNTTKLNDVFTYRMKQFHFSKQQIVEVIPGKKMVWLVTDSQLNFINDKDEWTGTKIFFEISEKNKQTELRFTHQGLTTGIECYDACSNGWSRLIQKSLFSLITTGTGENVF